MREHDLVGLLVDLPDYDLTAGAVGTVVHVHADRAACEVEFMDREGAIRAVLTLPASACGTVPAPGRAAGAAPAASAARAPRTAASAGSFQCQQDLHAPALEGGAGPADQVDELAIAPHGIPARLQVESRP